MTSLCSLGLPNGVQISCRPYIARAHTIIRFLFAASDGAAHTEPALIGLPRAFAGETTLHAKVAVVSYPAPSRRAPHRSVPGVQ